jgi:hypothetical protein
MSEAYIIVTGEYPAVIANRHTRSLVYAHYDGAGGYREVWKQPKRTAKSFATALQEDFAVTTMVVDDLNEALQLAGHPLH